MQQVFSKITLPAFLQKQLLLFRKQSFRITYIHIFGNIIPEYYNYNSYLLTPFNFRKLIRFYKKHFKIISLNEAVERAKNNMSLEGYLSLTTDDGYVENYTTIAPICLEEKVPITMFVSTNAIDNKHLLWNNKVIFLYNIMKKSDIFKAMFKIARDFNLNNPRNNENFFGWSMRTWDMKSKEEIADALWQSCVSQTVDDFLAECKPYLTVQQILELSDSSLISFGSHSKSHPMFNKLAYSEIKEEIIDSIEEIEKISGQKSKHFAYPNGLRPRKELEDRFIFEYNDLVQSILGIKNCLTNNGNTFQWEIDRQEFDYNLSVFRFLFLPVLRYYLK